MLISLNEFITSVKLELKIQKKFSSPIKEALEEMEVMTEEIGELNVKRSVGFFAFQLAGLVEQVTAAPLEEALDETVDSLIKLKKAVDYTLEQLKNG